MGNKQSKQQWKEIPIANDLHASKIISINHNQLVLMSFSKYRAYRIKGTIYIYDIASRRLTLFSKFPKIDLPKHPRRGIHRELWSSSYDPYTKDLYLITATWTLNGENRWIDHKLITIDMKTKLFTQKDINLSTKKTFQMVHINERLHFLLLDKENIRHSIYDKNTQKMECNDQYLPCSRSAYEYIFSKYTSLWL